MQKIRWSVRHMSDDALQCLREVQGTSGGLLGELVHEAVLHWYHDLEELTDGPSDDREASS